MKTFKLIITLISGLIFFNPVFAQENEPDAVYLKIIKEYNLNDDGSVDYRYHKELQINTHYAFHRLFGESFIIYNPEYQKLTINNAFTTMADGTVVHTPENAFNELLPRFARDAVDYNHLREMAVTHTGLEVGSVITLDYSIHSDREFQKFLMGEIDILENVPVHELEVIVRVPEGLVFQHKTFNIRTGPANYLENGKIVYNWSFRSLPATGHDAYSAESKEPRLYFSTARDMTMAFFSFVDQHAFKHMLSTEITKTAEKIAEENENELDIMLKLQDLVVNQISYVNVPLKYVGYTCRTPERVWKSAYGTKIEKAILLAEMLVSAGINAFPVAVTNEKFFDRSIGNLYVFEDFMVQVNPKRMARTYLRVDHMDDQNQMYNLEGKILVQLDAAIESMRSFEEKTAKNEFTLKGDFVLSDTNSISGELKQTASGIYNPYFKVYGDSAVVKKQLKGGPIPSGITSFKANKISQEETTADFVVEKNGALSDHGDYLVFDLPYFGKGFGSWRPYLLSEERNSAIDLHHLMAESYTINLELPKAYEMLNRPVQFNAKNAVGEVGIEISGSSGKIKIERSFELKKSLIAVNELTALQDLVNAWFNKQWTQIIIKAAE